MTSHLNTFVLERYAVADLPPAQADQARAHLSECTDCQGEFTALNERVNRDKSAWPEKAFMASLKARRRREAARRGAWLGAALAMAAGALVWLLAAPEPKQADVVALRGEGLAVHRQRGGSVEVLEPGAAIRAGDALRVVVTLSKAAPVDVWFVDASGAVDRPLTSEPLELGRGEHALPDSAVVSEPCADLWIVVGTGAAASSSTEEALKRLGPGARDPSLAWLPSGCFALPLRCE